MNKIKEIFSPEYLDKGIYWSFLIMAFSVFISSALAHNAMRLALILGIIRIVINPGVMWKIKKYKGFFITMGAFAAMMYASAVYGGSFWEAVHSESIRYNYQMLGTFAVCLFIHDKKKLLNILCAAFLSLLATDICIIWKSINGARYPTGFFDVYRYAWTAFMYTITLPPMMVYVLYHETEIKKRLFWIGVLILSIAALLINGVRGAWIAVFPIMAVMIAYRIRDIKKLVAIFGIIAVCLGGIMYSAPRFQARLMTIGDVQDHSQAQRFLFWQSATNMFLDHPVFGVGIPNYASLYKTKYISPLADEPYIDQAHNNFFQFLAEEGAIGASLYVIMIGYCLRWAWKRKENPFGLMALATTGALVIHSMSDYTWTMFVDMRLYWVLLGIGIRGVELTQPELLK